MTLWAIVKNKPLRRRESDDIAIRARLRLQQSRVYSSTVLEYQVVPLALPLAVRAYHLPTMA